MYKCAHIKSNALLDYLTETCKRIQTVATVTGEEIDLSQWYSGALHSIESL